MTVEINLNDSCEVVLTERGAKIMNEFWKRPNFHTAGEVYDSQLHHLMEVFGAHCFPSFDPFIEGNQIIMLGRNP